MHKFDEPVLASDLVQFAGQPLFAVLAESRAIARRAARLARIEYEELPAILDIETALAKKSFVLEPHSMQRGDPQTALASGALPSAAARSSPVARTTFTSKARYPWRCRRKTGIC